ncbi:MAG TPA: multidrug efflux RND transporter permease subunit [Gemmataceae bacterium]|nr:multidrug efflux RND transporter permease subunit [Gemmataceae bacterium]
MISRFFIDRPIFAAVLSILITLAGGIALFTLPLAQFPQITPPTVRVTANYPGASAKEVADSVAAPIEQQVNGVEGIMYMSSQCANDGSYNLTVTFHQGIDIDMAQVLVQNRVNLALPLLPEVIKATGVTTRKQSPDILMGLAINSPDGRYDQLYLSNFALMQIKDELARVPGVGDVFLFGQRDYSMRIWLDPAKLATRRMSATDVVQAIREQNSQVATGAIGQEPMRGRQECQITLSTLGRLADVEQFENIVLKVSRDGRIIRLKDVGRVELGAKNEDTSVRLDGRETVFLAIFQMPDANALDLHDRLMAKMEDLKQSFPEGVDYTIGFDTTPYTSESIHEVVMTLRDAIMLVAVVVLLFLQNWRSALIPLVAVPVAIIGTFAAMAAFGFSLNNLTLFGLVLAIGIVVDDAIVVVEAVEHHIEHGLSPRAATIKAMSQVSGPVIAVGLVLSAVFVPCAFISGITGQFFRQFALTIAVSTLISAFNSLTLSPALTALLLREKTKKHEPLPRLAFVLLGGWLCWRFLTSPLTASLSPGFPTWTIPYLVGLAGAIVGWFVGRQLNWFIGAIFRSFNRAFAKATAGYVRLVGSVLRVSTVALLVYAGLLATTYWGFQHTPRGFIPAQDMGYLMINVQLPDSASMERTEHVMRRLEKIALATPGIRHTTGICGQSFVLNAAGSNFGSMFINLKDYPDRRDPSLASDAIANKLREEFTRQVPDAAVAVFGPPPVRGVGRAGGFALMVEDRGDFGPAMLQAQTETLVRMGNTLNRAGQDILELRKQAEQANTPVGPVDLQPAMAGMFSVFRANVPQLHIHPDPRACMMRGVSMLDFANTVQAYEGSLYVNDFNRFGRTWQVIVQAESNFRQRPEDLPALATRNVRGAMVPLGALADLREVNGPLVLTRYNMYTAASINGATAPGVSSGQGIALLQHLAETELPQAMSYEWTDMSYLELLAGNTAMIIFAFAVVMVFLVLAAQYESWSLPLAVILVVPLCLLSAIIGVNIARMDINIFTQIGFVVLVGLASKNAILIVEFAKVQRHHGLSRRDATLEACKLRLRPIVMTSLSFILGVLPLIISHGAGAEMRRTLGTAVFSGMIGVTLFGLALTPVFFFTIDRLGESRLFASQIMRRTGAIALGVLTLGLRWMARTMAVRNRGRRAIPEKAMLTGPHGNGASKHPEPVASAAPQQFGEPRGSPNRR